MDDARPVAAHFDSTANAWVLSTHADVSAALRDARLSPSASSNAATVPTGVRQAAARAFSPDKLALWRAEIEQSAAGYAARLSVGQPVDLVSEFAAPWSLALAMKATRAAGEDATRLAALARDVFLAAAHSTDSAVPQSALAASLELAATLQNATTEASLDVQAFVALAHTLPGFLAGAWLELFGNAEAADRLRRNRGLMPGAIEELLRLAGPSRAVFRVALSDVAIGAARIRPGERVALMLAAANRDPALFADADRFDPERHADQHLAFGKGTHSCVGASMIRMAAAAATGALLSATANVKLIGEIDWVEGFAIRAPSSLYATLEREPPDASHSQNSQRPVPIT
ncbi:MAG: cytochrome P450 [bacterium]